MHIKCIKFQVVYIHNLYYMFWLMFTIFKDMIIKRDLYKSKINKSIFMQH